MIRQKFLPTVQPSSVQKNENKENQYQMQRDPLNSATHKNKTTSTMSKEAYKHISRTTKWNKNQKDEKTSQSETKTQKKTKNKKQTHNKLKQTETNFLEQDGGNRLLDNCLLKKHDDLHSY